MTRRNQIPPQDLAIGGGIAAICAMVMGAVLASLATPPQFKDRLAELTTGHEQAVRLARPVRNAEALGTDVICPRSAAQQAPLLAGALKDSAGQLRLELKRLDVSAGRSGTSGKLTPLHVRLETQGSYDGAVMMLDLIGKQRPQVFAETVDLTTKVSGVTMVFSGIAYCAG